MVSRPEDQLTPIESRLIHSLRLLETLTIRVFKILFSKPILIIALVLFLMVTTATTYLSLKSLRLKKEGTELYTNMHYSEALNKFILSNKYWVLRKLSSRLQDWDIVEKIGKSQIMVRSEDFYNKGIESFKNESYYEAIDNFNHMALKDPHYQNAQDTITQINKILEDKEKERQVELVKTQTVSNTTSPAVQAESYNFHDYYPIILSMQDDKGNILKISDYNGYSGSYQFMKINTGTKLKIGNTLFIRVSAKDPQGRNIQYNFNSNSDRFNDKFNNYSSSNELSYTVNEKDLKTAGEKLRVVVQIKSKKDYYRFNGEYDDATFLDYVLSP